jgi:pyrimidine operon attenuation protein/uracil phosphoribosyltransferase
MEPAIWKDVALLLAGILIGGLSGVIRGDWVGKNAATAVKEIVNVQLQAIREGHEKLETHVYRELRDLNEKVDRLLKEDKSN